MVSFHHIACYLYRKDATMHLHSIENFLVDFLFFFKTNYLNSWNKLNRDDCPVTPKYQNWAIWSFQFGMTMIRVKQTSTRTQPIWVEYEKLNEYKYVLNFIPNQV